MTRELRTHLVVAAVTATAVGLAFLAKPTALPFPGWWAFGSFIVIAFVLETLNTQLRVQAKGSTSFIMHIAAGLLLEVSGPALSRVCLLFLETLRGVGNR